MSTGQSVQTVPVKVGPFEEHWQRGVKRVGDRLHDLQRGICLAVGQIREERDGDVRLVGQLVLRHASFPKKPEDVGKKDLAVHEMVTVRWRGLEILAAKVLDAGMEFS